MTKETQFTPGPWKYGIDELGAACVYVPQNDGVDAILYMEPKGGWEDYANSWLIAQCPSLYKDEEDKLVHLKTLRNHVLSLTGRIPPIPMVTPEFTMKYIDQIIADTEQLLAKARGEEEEQ